MDELSFKYLSLLKIKINSTKGQQMALVITDAFRNFNVNGTIIPASQTVDTLYVNPGPGMTLTVSGQTVTVNAVPTSSSTTTASSSGYLGTPINTQSGSYTLAYSDQGGTIYSSGNITIPANGTTPLPVGTIINIIASAVITVSITSDTLQWGGQSTSQTGTRTLAQYAMATLIKVASTTWYISGTGVT